MVLHNICINVNQGKVHKHMKKKKNGEHTLRYDYRIENLPGAALHNEGRRAATKQMKIIGGPVRWE